MNSILLNLKSIFLNFKQLPKKALTNSYSPINSDETSSVFILLLALLSGLGNLFAIKFLPISIVNSLDKNLAKYKLDGIGGYFKKSYSPNITKYFMLGFILFLLILLICGFVSYLVKTNLFKTKENFILILKSTSLSLMPSVLFFLIANIAVIFSLMLYLFFIILGIATFVIYFYEHLNNLVENSVDRLCFICAVSFVIILVISLKINLNSDITNILLNPFSELLKNSL